MRITTEKIGTAIDPKNRVAFLSTIFKIEKSYILEFFESLSSQTVSDFDLIVLNDGFLDFHEVKKRFAHLNIVELAPAGSFAKNRQALIEYAKIEGYEIAIFGDCDDVFSRNRVEVSINELFNSDIVVNDLTSVKGDQVINELIYSHRLENRARISFDFIKQKNIFGLSNTAINLKCVSLDLVKFPEDLIAIDWFFFSKLLNKGIKAIFINEMVTFYRQYDANTIGIGQLTSEKVKTILKVKSIHYKYMKIISSDFEVLSGNISSLSQFVSSEAKLKELLNFNQNRVEYPLWWELVDCRSEK